MDSHYKIHSTDLVTDRPVPVDQDMLALVRTAPPPLATLHQWEEVKVWPRAVRNNVRERVFHGCYSTPSRSC